ncbi:recombination-associated protein RdgC [Duganella phyllosphaerae]|uniref:Recombination-associated protein RdgC n=2 Tax=Duganella phyllosphaerae TaxID=762836 RepID=A0A1E7W6C9_9BURK|nr:recombination-associated protein RdgC [Duganella phyllosphaerae]
MFKNLQIYRLPSNWPMTAEALVAALEPHAFTPASSYELLRQGWSAPRPNGDLVHVVNKQYLLKLETEKKLLPSTVVNQVAAARAAEMEEAQGFAPGKKAMKELKERVADELLPRAFSIKAQTLVWIDPVNGWLVVDAASPSKADEVIKLLLKAVDKLPLESLRVQRSPVGVMTEWLQTDEAPVGFTVDMDATLRATGESKAQVAYKRHTLEPGEVRRHIEAGKQCTRLAMTWESKISFVLDETLAIKSVKALDVLSEKESSTRNEAERFDGDFILMTGELAKMLAAVVEALGGEATMDAPGVEKRAAPPGQQNVERAVRLGAELYKQRALHRDVLGTLYEQTIEPYMARVRARMDEAGGAVEAAIALAKEQATGSTSAQLFLVAAVEIVEPSPRPAAGDEPVREQRVVTSLADDVPVGDGSATDPLYDQAVAVVRTNQRASISLIQRHLRVGYNRASRLLENMEGSVVGPLMSNGNRELLK